MYTGGNDHAALLGGGVAPCVGEVGPLTIRLDGLGGIGLDRYCEGVSVYSLPSSIVLNTWNHLIVTRTASGQTAVWLNGVISPTSIIDNRDFFNPTAGIGYWQAPESIYMPGSISSVRVVVGSSLYSPSSSVVTPLTLTVVSGTQLLFAPSSAADLTVDQSGVQSISNVGGVTFAASAVMNCVGTCILVVVGN